MAPKVQNYWPVGHGSFVFDGVAAFEAGATGFLAAGLRLRERLVFVADDPRPDLWPSSLIGKGDLIVMSTSEVYGVRREVNASAQLDTFSAALADALEVGYLGIRVAADNTSLVDEPARLEAWLEWEPLAEEFMGARPVTGLCSFDRSRLGSAALAAVLDVHRVVVQRCH